MTRLLLLLLAALTFASCSSTAYAGVEVVPAPGIQLQEEGTSVGQVSKLNCIGTSVTCAKSGATGTVTITGSSSPLTTKGDLYTYTSVDARLAVGADGLCLKTNSATGTGLEWNTCSATSAYSTVAEEGSSLTQRGTLNFIGADVTCVDNAGSTRTDCTVSAYQTALRLSFLSQ